jgi:hypothetical protein
MMTAEPRARQISWASIRVGMEGGFYTSQHPPIWSARVSPSTTLSGETCLNDQELRRDVHIPRQDLENAPSLQQDLDGGDDREEDSGSFGEGGEVNGNVPDVEVGKGEEGGEERGTCAVERRRRSSGSAMELV